MNEAVSCENDQTMYELRLKEVSQQRKKEKLSQKSICAEIEEIFAT